MTGYWFINMAPIYHLGLLFMYFTTKSVRFLSPILIMAIFLFVSVFILPGCAILPKSKSGNDSSGPSLFGGSDSKCQLVNETVGKEVVVCANTYPETCGPAELSYESKRLEDVELCSVDGNCVGKSQLSCDHACQRIVLRCSLQIKNKDTAEGTWIVTPTITQGALSYYKEPKALRIKPNGVGTFDFQQEYTYDTGVAHAPIKAECALDITTKPTSKVCKKSVDPLRVCHNETVGEIVAREVCT